MSRPGAARPPIVDRTEFDQELAQQVEVEKELTHFGDRVSARRRRLPMTRIEDHVFMGQVGPVRLSELFEGRSQLVLQSFMFHPDWGEGCPSCTWAVDNMPRDLDSLLSDKDTSFAIVSRAPISKLLAWREARDWDFTWVSLDDNSYNRDWGWTVDDEEQPGYTYFLMSEEGPCVTYRTERRGTEAILPVPAIWDRTVYGRQQDFEDSPKGWPQQPRYG